MLRQSSLRRLIAASAVLLAFATAASAQAPNVRLADDSRLDVNTPAVLGRLPVLFVHGHGGIFSALTGPNYQKNWQDSLRGLPSFTQILNQNTALRIEPYYINLPESDTRSITQDARAIGEAVELILHRHDPDYPARPTRVQVVIIAYSKGTISARQYLKSLQVQVEDLPAPRQDFRPVSEFIAIAPPNHGSGTPVFRSTSSLAVKQLYNGVRPAGSGHNCGDAFDAPAGTNYITDLNFNTVTQMADEAPGSRADIDPATGVPSLRTSGTLYVTLFDDEDRDIVGGDAPSTDCVGRGVATNLSPNAVNVPVDGIVDDGWHDNPLLWGFTDDEQKALAVHQNTVHTPRVICQALYAAVHHRSPMGQTCPDFPTIPAPARAAAVLTLDFSASMLAEVSPGRSRAVELKESVDLFVRLWSELGVASDRIGVTYFRTNVERYDLAGEKLPFLSEAATNLIGNVGGQGPSGSTAMGGGLQRSIETLNEFAVDTPIRRVILFTDGMQNINPMVMPVGDHHEIIDDQTSRRDSDVTPTNVRLDQLGGIKVDTIGIGASPTFVGLLLDIADETGGRSWPTSDAAFDLRRFFVEALIHALRGFSPQLVAYRHGAIGSKGSTQTFDIESGVRKLVLKVSWKRGDAIDFTVAKDGVDVTSAGRFIKGDFYKIFVMDFSAKGSVAPRGRWELRIEGKKGMAYETAAIVDSEGINYDGLFEVKRPKVGESLDLVVRLMASGKPISGDRRVTVKLMRPTTRALNFIAANRPKVLPSFEPGMTIPERRLLALPMGPRTLIALKPDVQTVTLKASDKGEFRGRFRTLVPGIYTAVVTIEGEDAKLGKFTRTLTASTVVRARVDEGK